MPHVSCPLPVVVPPSVVLLRFVERLRGKPSRGSHRRWSAGTRKQNTLCAFPAQTSWRASSAGMPGYDYDASSAGYDSESYDEYDYECDVEPEPEPEPMGTAAARELALRRKHLDRAGILYLVVDGAVYPFAGT